MCVVRNESVWERERMLTNSVSVAGSTDYRQLVEALLLMIWQSHTAGGSQVPGRGRYAIPVRLVQVAL